MQPLHFFLPPAQLILILQLRPYPLAHFNQTSINHHITLGLCIFFLNYLPGQFKMLPLYETQTEIQSTPRHNIGVVQTKRQLQLSHGNLASNQGTIRKIIPQR